jgi:hypothetical protein
VRVSAFLQFGAAIPLAIYAATVSTRVRTLGIRAPGATIAQIGGVLAAAFLALAGLVSWVLSGPEVLADPADTPRHASSPRSGRGAAADAINGPVRGAARCPRGTVAGT